MRNGILRRNLFKSLLSVVIFCAVTALIATGVWRASDDKTPPLIQAVQAYRLEHSGLKEDVSVLIQQFIPIGSDKTATLRELQKDGFSVRADLNRFMDAKRPLYLNHLFAFDELEIGISVSNNSVTKLFGEVTSQSP